MTVPIRTWVGDALASLLLIVGTIGLLSRDGGFSGPLVWNIPLILLVTSPVLIAELKHLSVFARSVVGVLLLGIIANAATAQIREFFPQSSATLFLLIATMAAAHRLMRASWGPAALSGLVAATLIWSWQFAAFSYAGAVWSDSIARWLPLSWHNQSAALMGGAGVFCLGVATKLPHRLSAVGIGIIGSLGLGAVWLTGSRGGLIATGLGVLMVLLMLRTKQELARALATVMAAAVITLGLVQFASTVDSLDLADRADSTSQTAQFRIDHWRAGWGMFAEDPLTGYGLGSYGSAAPLFAPPETHLTAFAHNEIVEHAAEGGALIALPLLAALVVGSWISLAFVLGPGHANSTWWAAGAGATGAWVTLAAHALIDFDWAYPILVSLLGLSMGVLLAVRKPPIRHTRGTQLGGFLVVVSVVLVVASAALVRYPDAFGFETNPLSAGTARSITANLLAQGDAASALASSQDALRWNPGDTTLETFAAIAQVELGDATTQEVLASLSPGRSRLSAYAYVTSWLYERGSLEEADDLADELIGLTNEYSAWGPTSQALAAWEVKFLVARQLEGCDGVRRVADELATDLFIGGQLDITQFVAECS